MKHAAVIWVGIFLCNICFGQASLNNGLVLHLPLDGNTNDVSGNAHTVKPRNIRFDPNCSGMPGTAAYFNGVNSLIEIPGSPALNTTEKITIAFWVKTESATPSTVLLSRAKRIPGEDPKHGYELGFNNFRQPLFSLITPPLCHIYTNWVSDSRPMVDNAWTSIIAVFDGVQQSIYVNGIMVGQSFTSFDKLSFCEADLPLFLGALFAEQENTLKGWMDELRIYSRALTEEEIRILSNTCTINTFCQAPTDLAVSGNSATSVAVNWKPSSGNTQFISEYRPVGSNNWLPGFRTGNANADITGLQTGITYELRLRAVCTGTDSSGWKPGTYTLLGDTRCDAPFNLQVTATGETSATLTWEALPAGIGVNIQYAEAGTGSWVDAASEVTDRTYTITGLNPGTAYEWRVQTACNLGPSTWAISTFTTTGVSPCRPPSGLLPFDLSGNRAALKWNPWAESQFFEVEYKLTTSSTWIRASPLSFSADRIYIDSLQPLTAYDWRVRALCSNGNSEWVTGGFITTPGRPIDAGIMLVADFSHAPVNCKPAEIRFSNSSIVTRTNMSTIQWSFGDGKISTQPEPVHIYDKPGTYAVSLTIGDNDGRTSAKTKQVTITSTSLRFAASSGNLTACSKEPLTLRAEGGVKYEWFPCAGLSDCNTATPTVIPGMHDRYTVRVTDRNGCTDTTSLTVRYVDPASGIYIPNIFTPNGDGLNDGFSPLAQVGIPGNHEVRIFDRFGSVILSSSKTDVRWDGTIKGKPAPTGNYSYLLRLRGEGSCASKDIKGTVMLVR